jgi:hypothetical protein
MPTTCKREREGGRDLGVYMNLHVYGCACECACVWSRDFHKILWINSDYSPKQLKWLDFLLRTCNLGPNFYVLRETVHTIFSLRYLKYSYEASPAETSQFFEITRE